MVIGKPIAKIFSCGAERVSTPSAALITSSVAISGSDSHSAARTTMPPDCASSSHWPPSAAATGTA